ncbi:MAG: hypothetical protein GXP31_03015 [Kiritimatiellaeota bacterium]|nr:hypothetical protein [Kiritimatiellota bacterium]
MNTRSFFVVDPIARRWPALARVMVGRITVLGVLFIALAALGPRDEISFYSFISLAFVINIPYALWLRKEQTARQSTPLQFLVDTLLVTGLVHFTGGLQSELVLLYPLVILSAGLVVSGEFSMKVTVLCISLYATLIVLEMQGLVRYYGPGPFPYTNGQHVVQALMLRIFVFTFFTAASSFLSDRLGRGRDGVGPTGMVSSLICNFMAPIALCANRQGKILFANKAAADFIGHPSDFIRGRDIGDFIVDAPPAAGAKPFEARMCTLTFQKTDGMVVHIPCSIVMVPAEVLAEHVDDLNQFSPTDAPLLLIVGWPPDAGEGLPGQTRRENDRMPGEILAGYRHSLLNALSPVKTAAGAFCEVLERVGADSTAWSPEDRELSKGLLDALCTGTGRLHKRIMELFPVPEQEPPAREKNEEATGAGPTG